MKTYLNYKSGELYRKEEGEQHQAEPKQNGEYYQPKQRRITSRK